VGGVEDGAARGRLVGVVGAAGAPDEAWALEPGRVAWTLLVDGIAVGELPAGAQLRVGASAVVELVPLSARDPRAPGGLAELGEGEPVPVRVLRGGPVRVGDPVAVEAVPVPLGDVLDLHSFRPDETRDALACYLAEARAAGLREVRIVHGRGRGVQRALVQRLLARAPEVAGFADASPERGGWGATVVRLRPGEPPARA
jgi:hypothetical protein